MNKMKFESPDMTAQNIDRIAALFPNCITEMLDEEHSTPEKKVYKRAVNFELLKQMLSPDVVDGDEAYEFTWVGKKAAIVEANKPIRKTLRPCVEESKDWDTTENIYIEGDNLEVLKLLQESYLGKVKMIYIDPPYNTGNDFIYADDFMRSQEEENEQMGMYDEDENRLFKNTDTNGRFHSDWCSMIYSRLMLARNLLTGDGVIFISIDENEVENAKKICNEAFGASNLVGTFIWRKKDGGGQANDAFVIEHEYILVYRKSVGFTWTDKVEMRSQDEYNKSDEKGIFKITKLAKWGNTARREDRPSMFFSIKAPDGTDCYPIAPDGGDGRWRVGAPRMNELIANELVHWEKRPTGWIPYEKEYFANQSKVIKERSILYNLANTGDGSNVLTSLFGKKDTFENPKPVELVKLFTERVTTCTDIILDFFSGSATTAHAVMQLNAEDGGHRKFIMVQLPEKCDEASEASKAGYKNICEIGKERIRRAGDKIKTESPMTTQDLDIGFRVLKLDDTNMKDVYYAPDDYDQDMLAVLESNIKDDRTDLDLLFGCLIDWGLPLSLPYKSEKIDGCTVHTYNDGDLIACFDANISESVVKEIAKRKPLRAVFRDSGFASSPEKINVFEIFKLYMPEDANDISKRVRVI